METSKKKNKLPSFKSLGELEAAKKEIHKKYSELESNAIANYFDPMKMAMDLAPGVLRFFKKSKKNKTDLGVSASSLKNIQKLKTDLKPASKKSGILFSINIVAPSKSKGFGNKVVAAFIRWQLFELSLWGVKKIIASQRKKA